MTQTNIDSLIENARKNADAHKIEGMNLPETTTQDNTPVVPAASTGTAVAMSMADAMRGGPAVVDHWLKISTQNGLFYFGEDARKTTSDFKVIFNTGLVRKTWTIRCGTGGNIAYFRTYDLQTTDDMSMSWETAILRAQQMDPTAKVYDSADIVLTAYEDIVGPKNEVLVPEGETIGKSTSMTEYPFLKKLYQTMMKNDWDIDNGQFLVDVVAVEKISKATGKPYYLMALQNPEPYDD